MAIRSNIKIIITLALISSPTSILLAENACRNFEGVFDCLDEYGDTTPVSFGFKSDSAVEYEGETVNYGAWTPLKDNQDLTQQEARATCKDRKLLIEVKGKDLKIDKKKASTIEWNTHWIPQDTLPLTQEVGAESVGRVTEPDGSYVDFGGKYICRRHLPMTAEGKQCPVLRGVYECPKADGTMLDVQIQQEDLAEAAVFTLSGYRVVANGQFQTIPVDYEGPYRDGKIKGWCSQGKMIMEINSKSYSRGVHTGQMILKMMRSTDKDGNLVVENMGSIVNLLDQHLPIRGKATCRRKATLQK